MSGVLEKDNAIGLNDAFAAAMRAMASTVSVITAADRAGERYGMTATSVTSVSMAPASLLVCINRTNASFDAVRETGRFCVNLLSDAQSQQCFTFATPGPKTDCFETETWDAVDGLPCLRDAAAVIVCRVAREIHHGSHGIFIGDVEHVSVGRDPVQPLVYLNREIVPVRPACG